MNENDISFKGAALFRRWSFPRTLARPRRPVSRMAIYGTVFVHFEAQRALHRCVFNNYVLPLLDFFHLQINRINIWLDHPNKRFELNSF